MFFFNKKNVLLLATFFFKNYKTPLHLFSILNFFVFARNKVALQGT